MRILDALAWILAGAVLFGVAGEIRTRHELAELERNPFPADVRLAP